MVRPLEMFPHGNGSTGRAQTAHPGSLTSRLVGCTLTSTRAGSMVSIIMASRKMARGQISVIGPAAGHNSREGSLRTLVDEKELGGAVGAGQFRCGNVSLQGNSSLRGIGGSRWVSHAR